MKARLLPLLLLVFSINSYAQTGYIAFPDSGAVWLQRYCPAPASCYATIYDQEIYITKDTVINGFTYQQLKYNGYYSHSQFMQCPPWIILTPGYYNGTYGYYRNDTAGKRVYILRYELLNDSIEQLLYDFSKNAGDTVFAFPAIGKYVIDSIGTVPVGSVNRTCHYIHYPDHIAPYRNTRIIQGIGSEQGLVPQPYNWECYADLLCYSEFDDKLYPDTVGQCQHINAMQVYSGTTNVVLYPNPADEIINIATTEALTNVKLFSSSGTLVYSGISPKSMDVKNLSPGLYWVWLRNEKGQTSMQKVAVLRNSN